MARFDVDAGAVTNMPSSLEWVQPRRLRRGDGGSTRSAYWQCRLYFEADGDNELPAAAFEEWEAFDDGAAHSVVLPPPNNVLGSDATYSSIYIEIENWPAFVSVNVGPFTVLVSGISFTS